NAALTVNPPKGGDVDYSFAAASINERVGSIAVQPDGKILITEVRGGRVQGRSRFLSLTEKLICGKHRRFRESKPVRRADRRGTRGQRARGTKIGERPRSFRDPATALPVT